MTRIIPLQQKFIGSQDVNIDMPISNYLANSFEPTIEVADDSIAGFDKIWEDDLRPGYETRLDWRFKERDVPPIIVADHPNFNGFGGLDVTYPAGALASVRWGGSLRVPNKPTGYPEGIFEIDYMLHTPFPIPVNCKGPGIFGSHDGWGFPGSPVPECDDGWLCRVQFGNGNDLDEEPNGPQPAHMYTYTNQATRVNTQWGGVTGTPIVVHDTVSRIRLYWKINSAFNVDDGIVRYFYDAGTANAHATPTTLRAERTNMRCYCNTELNRPNAFMNDISLSSFFGGPNDPIWAPSQAAKLTLGRMALYIPV